MYAMYTVKSRGGCGRSAPSPTSSASSRVATNVDVDTCSLMEFLQHKELWGALSLVFCFVKFIPGFWGMYKGTVKPHAITLFIWSFPTTIIWLAQMVSGGGAGAWNTLGSTILNFLFFLCALKYGYPLSHITKSDWMVLGTALLAIPLWIVTHTPFYSVMLLVFIDLIAFAPTFRKSWHLPHQEAISAYVLANISWLFSLLAMAEYNIINLAYPVSILVSNIVFILFLMVRRRTIT